MRLEPIIGTLGYLLGALLQGLLLRVIARRPRRRAVERLLGATAAAMLVWNAANLVEAYAELLTGSEVEGLERVLDVLGVAALAAVPSLILHTLAALRRPEEPPGPGWLLVYAPLPLLGAVFLALPPAAPAVLGAWLSAALLAGALAALDLARRVEGRPGGPPEAPRLYRFLAAALAATAALAAAIVFALGWRRPGDHALLTVLVVLGSSFPTLALAYGAYRYYAIRPLLRRGAVNVALALLALGVYLLGISTFSRGLERAYGWNVRAVEAVGILALVLLFQPFRRRTLEALAWAFDPRGTEEMAVLRGLAQDLTRPGASRPSELAARVANGLRQALALAEAGLAVRPEPGQPVHASPPDWIDWSALVRVAERLPAAMLAPEDLPDPMLERSLEAARVERVRPLRYEGEPVGVLVLGRRADSTALRDDELLAVEAIAGPLAAACTSVRLVEQKLALELRLADAQRLAGLGRLSATVAHRVKNPLASIKALAQAMREDLPSADPRRQDLGIMVEEVDALARVVNQLLGFARGAPGGESGPVDARKVAEDVCLLMQHQAGAAEVRLDLRGAGGLPPVRAEPSALREALANLVENAILFSPKGGAVRVEVERAGEGLLRIRVRDEGPGVPPEARGRLFEPFFTTRPGGTGLGLAVARQRVAAWGGRLELEPPREGAPGASFACELPVADGVEGV